MNNENHKEIVTSLMGGKFITANDAVFAALLENQPYYEEFFKKSFGVELVGTHDYYHLVSEDTNEHLSRDVSIFFSILCYELDKDGRNFQEELQYSEFHIDELTDYFENTSWSEIVKSNKQLNTSDNVKKLVASTLVKRNIAIKHPNNNYSFTKAYKLFIDFAKELISTNIEDAK